MRKVIRIARLMRRVIQPSLQFLDVGTPRIRECRPWVEPLTFGDASLQDGDESTDGGFTCDLLDGLALGLVMGSHQSGSLLVGRIILKMHCRRNSLPFRFVVLRRRLDRTASVTGNGLPLS